MDYLITDYGARPEPGFDNRHCIQKAVDTCAEAGGGRVVVPRGTFLSGEIHLRSHVDFHLEQGAVLLGSPDVAAYPTTHLDLERTALLCADNCERVSITGEGTIDDDCRAWTGREDQYYLYAKEGVQRPFTVMFNGCRQVTVKDITIRNGKVWTLVPSGCDDVLIQGVRIYNDLRMPNSDAIDIVSCRNVRIIGCHIEAGDDCIVLKTYRESKLYSDPACDGVLVTGCTLVSTSSALVIGCEVFGPIRNVVFSSCVIRNSNRGLSINLSKECDVENVIFSDMTIETRLFENKWWGHGEPVKISAIPWLEGDAIGRVRNVTVRNLYCRGENAVVVYGWTKGLIEHILFDNVTLCIDRWSRWPGGEMDLRPTPQDGESYSAGLVKQPLSAFMLKNAADVTLRNCHVEWGSGAAASGEFRHALAYDNVTGLKLENFQGRAVSDQYDDICETEIRKPLGAR